MDRIAVRETFTKQQIEQDDLRDFVDLQEATETIEPFELILSSILHSIHNTLSRAYKRRGHATPLSSYVASRVQDRMYYI